MHKREFAKFAVDTFPNAAASKNKRRRKRTANLTDFTSIAVFTFDEGTTDDAAESAAWKALARLARLDTFHQSPPVPPLCRPQIKLVSVFVCFLVSVSCAAQCGHTNKGRRE